MLGFGTTSNKIPPPPIRSPSHAREKFRRPKTKKKLNFSTKLLTLNPRNFSFEIYRKKIFFSSVKRIGARRFSIPNPKLKKALFGFDDTARSIVLFLLLLQFPPFLTMSRKTVDTHSPPLFLLLLTRSVGTHTCRSVVVYE